MFSHNQWSTVIAGASFLSGSLFMLSAPEAALAQFAGVVSPPSGVVSPLRQPGVYNPNFPPPYTLTTPSTPAGSGSVINNSTLINPTIVNSTINNSTLINPTVIHSSVNSPWVNQPIVLPVAVNAQVLVPEVLSPNLVVLLQSYNLAVGYRYYRQVNANAVYLQVNQQAWSSLSNVAKLQLIQQFGTLYAGQGISVFVQSYGQVGLGQYICSGPALCTSVILL